MSKACSTHGGETEWILDIGEKARMNETTIKTKK
jgi:hypothetical protein